MSTIWKFPLAFEDVTRLVMPKGAEILTVQTQFNEPVLWAVVDQTQKSETRYFEIFITGQTVPDLDENKERKYINTFQLTEGSQVFHVFELKAKRGRFNEIPYVQKNGRYSENIGL